jgi:hypothetical protein
MVSWGAFSIFMNFDRLPPSPLPLMRGGEGTTDLLRVVLQLDVFRLLSDGIDGENGAFGHAEGSVEWGHRELSQIGVDSSN